MHPKFAEAIEQLHYKFEELTSGPSYNFNSLPKIMPLSGVYLFSENDVPLYIGRSNSLRKRYKLHCLPGSQHNQATFAFKLVRKTLGLGPATYKSGPDSRAGLATNPEFIKAFSMAKERIRTMQYRFVEETDQKRQTLLEHYCAIALDTEFNDFRTY